MNNEAPLEIKGLHEATGSDPEFMERLRNTMMINRLRLKMVRQTIVKQGGNIHPPISPEVRARRRAAGKAGRKQRLSNDRRK